MKKLLITLLFSQIFVFSIYSQLKTEGNKFGYALNDCFNYKNNKIGHYSLEWTNDDWNKSGVSLYMTSWGGIKFFTYGVYRLGINSLGNVGIGTETPQYKLDVNGNSRIINNLYLGNQLSPSAGGEVIRMSIVPYRHTGGPWNFVSRDTPSQAHLDINYGTLNALTIYAYNNETRIGIGTKNPQNKLDVAGTIRATEVKVETGWADFVFNKDYKLRSLDEVKAHIDEHKHLPDMPSETKVKEDGGVGLGEMQVKLLQKIEELTLYMIQQDKKINEQEQRIQELERQK